MKKIFLTNRNALFSSIRLSLGGAVLIAVILLLALRIFFPNLFWMLVAPVLQASHDLSRTAHTLTKSLGDARALVDSNKRLEEENMALARELYALREEREVTVGLAAFPGIVAGVLAHPPQSPYDTLVLAAGSDEGVVANTAVFAPGSVPIGFISSVAEHVSHATLFSSPGSITAAWAGTSRLPITLTGAGGGAFGATAPKEAALSEGDTIFVSGPGSLPIGTITRIESDPSSTLHLLRITPVMNLFSLTWVSIRE